MSREIGFRAWINEEMIEVKSIDFDDVGNLYRVNGEIVNPLEVKLLQYTGLKDRTGAKIYEGDVLELVNEDSKRIHAICKFGNRRLIHAGNTIDIKCFYFEVEGRKTNPVVGNYKGVHDLEIMEIRGNIYEDKELLKGVE